MVQSLPTDYQQSAGLLRKEIDAALEEYVEYDDDCPPRLREAIRHSLLAPGKRLRPQLVLMSAVACGSPRSAALPAACAVEMVHAYSLIHDDLPAMDDDDLRRGRPSCHAKFGEALAILAGDALLARAFEVLAGGIQPPGLAGRCCQALARAAGASALVGGQVDDLGAETDGGDLQKFLAIHRRKTGALFEVSLQLGGLVAEAEPEQLAALHTFGSNLGLAFQITDDLLDSRGSQIDMGKRTGKDVERGKLTFPALMGIEKSRQEAKRLIEQASAALSVFGPSACSLEALAAVVLERNR